MALLKDVVAQHEITVEVNDNKPGMVQVTIRLPGGAIKRDAFVIDLPSSDAGKDIDGLKAILALVAFGVQSAQPKN